MGCYRVPYGLLTLHPPVFLSPSSAPLGSKQTFPGGITVNSRYADTTCNQRQVSLSSPLGIPRMNVGAARPVPRCSENPQQPLTNCVEPAGACSHLPPPPLLHIPYLKDSPPHAFLEDCFRFSLDCIKLLTHSARSELADFATSGYCHAGRNAPAIHAVPVAYSNALRTAARGSAGTG